MDGNDFVYQDQINSGKYGALLFLSMAPTWCWSDRCISQLRLTGQAVLHNRPAKAGPAPQESVPGSSYAFGPPHQRTCSGASYPSLHCWSTFQCIRKGRAASTPIHNFPNLRSCSEGSIRRLPMVCRRQCMAAQSCAGAELSGNQPAEGMHATMSASKSLIGCV